MSSCLRFQADEASMIVLALEPRLVLACVAVTAAFEFLRILIAYVLARPPDKIKQLQKEKAASAMELSEIKSVQLEFVKHSLLTRKLIKFDKEIEKLQFNHGPVAARVRKWMRILRVVVYAAFAYYVNFTTKVVLLEPLIIWPLSWFCRRVEEEYNDASPLFLLVALGLAWRHIFRTCLIYFRNVSLP